jgi:glycosyltransferase involved in cell wall biosynthesis
MLPQLGSRRVLMTCDAIGGVWRYAVDLAGALQRQGVETVLVGSGPAPRAEAAALARPPIWLEMPPTWVAGKPSDVERLGAALGQLQRAHRADLVQVNQPAEAACLEVDVPVVVAAHSCLTTWWRAVHGDEPAADWRWRARLEAEGFRRADAVIAPSRSHAAAVRDAYGIPLPALVPNASAAPAGSAERGPLIVAAGRWWDAGKNLEVLDAAAAQCRWPVLVFGSLEGPDGSRVSPRHVRALGARPSDEVLAAMRRAAVFVSPSLYEPFGLAALEAARSGAALVLADIPTYREIWDGAARFFHPGSAAGLLAALDGLARDEAERLRLAEAATRRADAFSLDAQVAALAKVYSGVLPTGGATLKAAG